jgi:threonine 3-dehydrogenase
MEMDKNCCGPEKILVIGGAGAIGRYLLKKLITHYGNDQNSSPQIIAALRRTSLSNDLSSSVICEYGFDLCDEDSIRSLFEKYHGQISSVWNLAAPLSIDTAKDPTVAYDITVNGMKRLLACMKEYEVKSLFFSDSIGSFGITSPRENCSTLWLAENPNQDPGSDYGVQKRFCRDLLHEYSINHNFDTRFVIIPGVLHLEPTWAGGTTEYALDAIKAAIDGKPYVSPVSFDTKLPMIHVNDLVNGMVALMSAPVERFQGERALCRGVCLAGFSFTPQELFDVIRQEYPDFVASYCPEVSPHVTRFSVTWPDSLDPTEAKEIIDFESVKSFEETIREIIRAHRSRLEEIN